MEGVFVPKMILPHACKWCPFSEDLKDKVWCWRLGVNTENGFNERDTRCLLIKCDVFSLDLRHSFVDREEGEER